MKEVMTVSRRHAKAIHIVVWALNHSEVLFEQSAPCVFRVNNCKDQTENICWVA